jgi:hypothetical protein
MGAFIDIMRFDKNLQGNIPATHGGKVIFDTL